MRTHWYSFKSGREGTCMHLHLSVSRMCIIHIRGLSPSVCLLVCLATVKLYQIKDFSKVKLEFVG